MFLGKILQDFTTDNTKKTGLKGIAKVFFVDYNAIDTKNILDIHRYLMKEKKIFIGLLTSTINASNHRKCVSLNNQKCMIQPTLINLHPN